MTNAIEPRPLGAIAYFDDLSRNFLLATTLAEAGIVKPRSYTWSCAPRLNQDGRGACVGFSVAHEIAARPVVRPVDHALAMLLYDWSQAHDPFTTTPPEEGTALLTGLKAGVEYGYIGEYRWAGAGSGKALEDAALGTGYRGPGLAATLWFSGMDTPDAKGFIRPTGSIRGRHAYLINGVTIKWLLGSAKATFADVDLSASFFRIHNSWGAWWGINGEAFITLADFNTLQQAQGEFAIITKRLVA